MAQDKNKPAFPASSVFFGWYASIEVELNGKRGLDSMKHQYGVDVELKERFID